MSVLRYLLLFNWTVAFCNGYCRINCGNKPTTITNLTITEPFAFQTWDDFYKKSKTSSKELLKNPVSYSNKSATTVEMILEPLKMSKINYDENVRLEGHD